MIPSENIRKSHITQTLQAIFRSIYKYMHVTAINEKRDHKLGIEQGRVYGKSWKEEKKGEIM